VVYAQYTVAASPVADVGKSLVVMANRTVTAGMVPMWEVLVKDGFGNDLLKTGSSVELLWTRPGGVATTVKVGYS
jgi:hypothetical protein